MAEIFSWNPQGEVGGALAEGSRAQIPTGGAVLSALPGSLPDVHPAQVCSQVEKGNLGSHWVEAPLHLRTAGHSPAHPFLITHVLKIPMKNIPWGVRLPNSFLQVKKLGVSDGGEYQPRPQRELGLELDTLPVEPQYLPDSGAGPCLRLLQWVGLEQAQCCAY